MFGKTEKLKLLWEFMRGQRGRYVLAIAAMLAATFVGYLVPLVIGVTLNYVIQGKPRDGSAWIQEKVLALLGGLSIPARTLWIAAATGVLLTAVSGLCNYLRGRLSAQASEAVARRLRDRLYEHLQHVPCSYHDRTDTGDLVQRCTSDVDTVRSFMASQAVDIGRAILMVVTVLPFMLVLNTRLTLLALALVPVIIGFSVVFLSRVTWAFKASDEAEGQMTNVLQENLTGIRVVRAFARQAFEREKFAVANAQFRDTTVRLINLMAWYWSASDYTCHLQSALVLMLGGYWVMDGQAEVGTLFAFLAYEGMLLWPIRQMGRLLTELGKTTVSMGRILEILSQPDEEGRPALEVERALAPPAGGVATAVRASASGDRSAGPLEGAISFRNISFSYDGTAEVLSGVTFDIAAGQTVAILGPSGSGKSTLVQLLLRLYEYSQGSITIDGRELRMLDRRYVRGNAGVVLQEPFLYSKNLRDNISLGGAAVGATSDDRVAEAASAAAIHESILSFENGYDTLVGERGVTLSGGQRQRVALARAILKNPPILILDDALSAVDTRTESLILSALRRRRGRKTTLVIAHRLSTLMQADQIIVLEHGRVVQTGTHQSLLAEAGLYRRLWTIQSALEDDLAEELRQDRSGGHDNA